MGQESIDPEDITPEFKDEREEGLYSIAQAGMAAQSFLDSQTGRLVIDAAQKDVDAAAQALLTAKPEAVLGLQHKAMIAHKAIGWILDAINDGELAYQKLEEINNE